MSAPASANSQSFDANGRPKGWLSPTNRRRWANFKANRRGYWSLWIFMILFIASLLAEFIANDRPILASYKGEILYPVLVDYPEEKFGGFFARTDYRDPFVQEEIEWQWLDALAAGPLLLSHREQRISRCLRLRRRPGCWTRRKFAVQRYPGGVDDPNCVIGNMELARDRRPGPRRARPADLRLPDLGPVRPDADPGFFGMIGIAAGAVQGYFGGWTDLFPALHRDLDGDAGALSDPDHRIRSHHQASGFCSESCSCLFLGVAGRCGARGVPSRPQLRICAAARALGVGNAVIMFSHLLPNAMVATLTFLPFILNGSIYDADLAGLSRLRPAARFRLAGENCWPRARTTFRHRGWASPASS
jgi:microcin C transport system permease protein